MSPVTIAYLAALGGTVLAILRTLPARHEWRYMPAPAVPHRRLGPTTLPADIANANPEIYWPDTDGIEVLRAEPFTGDNVLMPAPAQPIEYASVDKALADFCAVMAPILRTLESWHDSGDGCLICAKLQLDAQRPAARLARLPVLRSSVNMC